MASLTVFNTTPQTCRSKRDLSPSPVCTGKENYILGTFYSSPPPICTSNFLSSKNRQHDLRVKMRGNQ